MVVLQQAVSKHDMMPLSSANDIVCVRQTVRQWAQEQGFRLVDQTKIVTAASELARNTITYGGGGTMQLQALKTLKRCGLQLTFTDEGPGIADIPRAMQDGYTTGGGLGLGLGGAKRLSQEFELYSRPGEGTWVRIVRWT